MCCKWEPLLQDNVPLSLLPTFLLPCAICGGRMVITTVEPAWLDSGARSDDLEDVTHTCVQCGAMLTRLTQVMHA